MISTEKKFIFVHIPKTGGNSISVALQPFSVDNLVFNSRQTEYNVLKSQVHRFGISNPLIAVSKHATLSEYKSSWSSTELGCWRDYLSFTVVRNTWDRLISYYFSPHRNISDFCRSEFVQLIKSKKVRSQLDYIQISGEVEIQKILRFENLATEFKALCSPLQLTCDLPHVNGGEHDRFRGYYDSKLAALVAEEYRAEIGYFGYAFD